MDTPEISAILTTRNRAALLPMVLDGLRSQTLAADRFEIVAIDDGSTDATAAVLEAARAGLPLRIVRQAHSGLACAKNRGIDESRGRILVFLDDDDVAAPRLLEAHLQAHARHPAEQAAVLGHTQLAPQIAAIPLMRHVTQVGCQLFSYGSLQPGAIGGYREFWGGRSSCKRSLLTAHGRFNPVFTFGCEDIELGWRLSRVGLFVVYEPAAESTMIRNIGFRDFCRRSERQGRSQWQFSRLHPDPEVRAYCEIDAGLALWARHAGRFAQFTRWVARLDRVANARVAAMLPIDAPFQGDLDEAYRAAFQLSRAKGIAEAATALAP